MLRRDPVRVSTLRPVKRPRVLQLPLLGLGPFGLHPRALQEEGFEVRSLAVDVVAAIPGNSSTQWLTGMSPRRMLPAIMPAKFTASLALPNCGA